MRAAAATSPNCYPPSSGGGSKQNARTLADPVGLFGRPRTLFKFYARISGSFAEHFNPFDL